MISGSARPVLDDVPPAQAFWTCSGVVIHNLTELSRYLAACSEEHYRYHVNTDHDKNDFSTWVRDVVHDEVLARNLGQGLTKKQYATKIVDRLHDLLSWEHDDQVRKLARA